MAQRYGKMPSDIIGIENPLLGYNFSAAIMYTANRIEKDGTTDPKEAKQKQTEGFANVKALQRKVQDSIKQG